MYILFCIDHTLSHNVINEYYVITICYIKNLCAYVYVQEPLKRYKHYITRLKLRWCIQAIMDIFRM